MVAPRLLCLLLLACGGSAPKTAAPPTTPGIVPQCDLYKGSDTYSYCLYKFSATLPDPATVKAVCAQAGAWELRCRQGWATGHMAVNSGVSTEALLDVCGAHPDCTLEVIEGRPDPDIATQLARCEQWTGRFAADCDGHALQRWWMARPDAAGVTALLGIAMNHADNLGYWAAAAVFCSKVGDCGDGASANGAACQRALTEFTAAPAKCNNLGMRALYVQGGRPERSTLPAQGPPVPGSTPTGPAVNPNPQLPPPR